MYPPLMLNFSKKESSGTLFKSQDKLKLVTPCQTQEYVVNEYLVYRLYNLLTPKSFRARLVRVTFADTVKQKKSPELYGILLEEDDQMAKRNGLTLVVRRLVKPEQTRRDEFLMMAVFQFMIGNTDWSVQYLQNIKLFASDSLGIPTAVPYDFDHAGIVEAYYAKPAPELQLANTRQRRYRGFCMPSMEPFAEVIGRFNELKEQLYDVYRQSTWIDERYRKRTIRFLDDFYEIINDPKRAKEAFLYPCRKDGTGNVVIKGLKE